MSDKDGKIEDQAKHIAALEKRGASLLHDLKQLRAEYIKLENDSLERINDMSDEMMRLRKRIIEMNAQDYRKLREQLDERKVAGSGESPAGADRSP